MDWTKAIPLLEAKLDPAHVKKPEGRGGPKGDYIEGWWAIAEANRIFGHDGWSYTIKNLTRDDLREGQDSKGRPQWQAAYTCIVTVNVGDVTREDVGFGSGFAKHPGDAIEGATKEAVTDALKRALRTFGWPFGLALYDKARANVGRDEPQRDPAKVRDGLLSAIGKVADHAGMRSLLASQKYNDAIRWLGEVDQPKALEVTHAATRKEASFDEAENGLEYA